MHRIDGTGATEQNLFTEGDPASGVPATQVTADWLNDLQEEVASPILQAGLTLQKGQRDQLLKAFVLLANTSVPTLADLRAIPAGAREYVALRGRDSIGDGGAGPFYWDASSTEADNGGTIIKPAALAAADPGRWLRVRRELLLIPEWFGAKGDGAIDDADAFTAMFASVKSNPALIKLTPGKTYLLGNRVTTESAGKQQINIVGYGAKLHLTGSGGINLRSSNVVFEGVTITQDPATAAEKTYALDILNVSGVTVRDCTFDGLKHAALKVRADATGSPADIKILSCRFRQNSSGDIALDGYDDNHRVRRVTIHGCHFESPTDPLSQGATQIRAIHVISWAEHITISDCIAYGIADASYTSGWRDGIMVGNSSATGRPENVLIDNCSITGMSDDAVGISGAVNVTVRGSTLYNSPVTSGVYVPANGTWANDNVTVAGCTIYGHALAGVYIKDTLHYKVVGNTIYDCNEGVLCIDQGVGVVGGEISYNSIRDVLQSGIVPVGSAGVSVIGNTIDGFGSPGSTTVTDQEAIFVKVPGTYTGNNILNGPIAFLYNGSPQNILVEGNTGSGVGDMHRFVSFTGDRYAIKNNIIAATNVFVNQPAASTTKIYKDNL